MGKHETTNQAEATPSNASSPVSWANWPLSWENLAVFGLLLILLLGAYLRFTGLNWDETYHLHPDERFLTDTASLLRLPESVGDYLRTSTSPLNPYNVGKSLFVYGNFPMTVTRYVGEWVTQACTAFTLNCTTAYNNYNGIHLIGRALSGLMDLLTIAFLFLIGRRLYDWRVGLLAALLHALAVMPIQQSHFFTMDNWAAALTVVTLYTAVRAASFGDTTEKFPTPWYALFGFSLGLTLASRINIAPLGLTIGLAALIWLARRGYTLADWLHLGQWSDRQTLDFQRIVLGGMLAIVLTMLVFRLAQPYAFTDATLARQIVLEQNGREPTALEVALRSLIGFNPQWQANMAEIQRLQAPEASFPPALQWVNRAPILFPLVNMVLYGMGFTAAIAAWLAFAWALWRIATLRPDWLAHLLPVAWTGLYFLFMGTRWVKSIRYFLPIYPTLFLLAAWGLFRLWQLAAADTRRPRLHRTAVIGLMLAVIVPSLVWAGQFVHIYQQPVTRVTASEWIFAHVPSGATLLYEVNGTAQELQLPLKQFEFQYEGVPLALPFVLPEGGVVTAVRLNYLRDPDHTPENSDSETLHVSLGVTDGAPEVQIPLNLGHEREGVLADLPDTAYAAGQGETLLLQAGPGGRIQASTSLLMNEHWDDLLPISTNGRNAYGSYYTEVTGGQRPVTNPDNEEKRRELLQWLDEADYIMISSQRALWHLPRLPLTYPMMLRYYSGLFDGSLGFQLVAEFHATHQVGPLYFSDTAGAVSWGEPPQIGWPPPAEWAAEEAFSVYDHPPVWIFQKTAAYNHDAVAQLFGDLNLSNPIVMNPKEATQAPGGLMLTADAWRQQRLGGTFNQIFAVDGVLNQSPALAAIIWWLAVVALGWLTFPLTFVVLGGLPDKGYGLARVLALLFISYFGWILASYDLLPNTRQTLWLGTAVLGSLSLLLFWRHRHQLAIWVATNWRYMLVAEGVGVLLYLILIGVRLGNPDVWDVIWGGEKPMDLSYFTAVLRSTTFPPYDPWYAGGYINYYYYGFVYVGSLTKLLGILPALAYNLILPMLFSFTGLGTFSLAYNLVLHRTLTTAAPLPTLPAHLFRKAVAAGLIAAALSVLLGNLGEVGVVVNTWYKAGNGALEETVPLVGSLLRTLDGGLKLFGGQPAPIYPGDWFWTASRAINANPGEVQPITEFPFFTFLYGDLHAHMIALPLTLLALGWAVALALSGSAAMGLAWWETAGQWLIGGLAIGALRATNTWDWPTYLVIGGLAVTMMVWQRNGRFSLPTLLQAAILTSLLVGLSILTFWPFVAHYGTAYTSLSFWPGSYTYLTNYLTIYGLFLLFILTYLAWEFRAWTCTWTLEGMRGLESASTPLLLTPIAYVLLLLALVYRGYWIGPVVLTLIMAAGLLGLRPNLAAARRIVLILIASALGLTLVVEVVVLDGDIGRMNTVFKFYMQVWTLLSVVGGVTAVWVYPAVRRRSRMSRRTWQGVLTMLVLAALLYPILATRAKWAIRMNQDAPHTLDGMAFMPSVSYGDVNNATISLSYDYDAIQWMYRHIVGSPVIVEGHSHNYGNFSPYRTITNRVAMYTGLPAVVGWDWHQRQQRSTVPGWLISNRIDEVNAFYHTPDVRQAMNFLQKYEVEYIYAGQLEWVYYNPEGMRKFDLMVQSDLLEEVYRNKGVTVYHVK